MRFDLQLEIPVELTEQMAMELYGTVDLFSIVRQLSDGLVVDVEHPLVDRGLRIKVRAA